MVSRQYVPRYQIPSTEAVLEVYDGIINGVHESRLSLPTINAWEFDRLVDSICEEGLMLPILIDEDGMLLEGLCRLCAVHVLRKRVPRILMTQNAGHLRETGATGRKPTLAERLIAATIPLLGARWKAEGLRRKGAKRGRETMSNPRATYVGKKRPRNEPILNAVARQEGVPREKLRIAEKIRRYYPSIAYEIERGELDWESAVSKAGLSQAVPVHSPSRNMLRSLDEANGTDRDLLLPSELQVLRHFSNLLCRQRLGRDGLSTAG